MDTKPKTIKGVRRNESPPTTPRPSAPSNLVHVVLDLDAPRPAPVPLVLGVLHPGSRHVLCGEPASGKSWLALCACAELIAAGKG